MGLLYDGYEIESFEAESGLWHARIRRSDQKPFLINGSPFPTLEIGFAWSDEASAVTDAKKHIDRCKHRWADAAQIRAA